MFLRRRPKTTPKPTAAPAGLMQYRAALREVRALPKDVGWMLLVSGLAVDLVTPGIPPYWIFGVLVIWPHAGLKLTAPIHKHYPGVFKGSLKLINRYVQDLEARYPRHRRKSDPIESSTNVTPIRIGARR